MSLHQEPKNGVLTGDSRPRKQRGQGLYGRTGPLRPRLDGEGATDGLGQYLQSWARVECAPDPETLLVPFRSGLGGVVHGLDRNLSC